MDRKASERLKIGRRVQFIDGVLGSVIETGYSAVKISWDDGQVGIIHHDDMQDVSLAQDPDQPPICDECGNAADVGHANNCSKRAWR